MPPAVGSDAGRAQQANGKIVLGRSERNETVLWFTAERQSVELDCERSLPWTER